MLQKQQDEIWDYYENENKDGFLTNYGRLKYLITYIKKTEKRNINNVKVLDIGIGNGDLEELAVKEGIAIYALDPNAEAIENLRKKLGSRVKADLTERFVVGYSQSNPFKNDFFDYVIISEVIEHLEEDIMTGTLLEIQRILKKGGKVIGTVPANENLKESECYCPYCRKKFHKVGHINSFTEHDIKELLNLNFKVLKIVSRRFPNYHLYNMKGKLYHIIITALRIFGIHSGQETIFWVGQK